MKMAMKFPLLVGIVVLAAACGKNKDEAGVLVAAPVAAGPTAPVMNPPPAGQDIAAWCYQRGGFLNTANRTCRLTEITQFEWNQYYGTIDTGIFVYPGDSVAVSAKGGHEVYVANASQPGNFVAQAIGPIVVKGIGTKPFRLRSVEITRCYSAVGYAVACQ
jgi:hypothetical protein